MERPINYMFRSIENEKSKDQNMKFHNGMKEIYILILAKRFA
jgi:hypothetical protein